MYRFLCGIATFIGLISLLCGQDFRTKERAIPDPNRKLAVAQFLAYIPDPSSLIAIAGLAMKQSVASEIALSSNAKKTLDNLHRDSRNPKEALGPLVDIGRRPDAVSKFAFSEIQIQIDQLFEESQKVRLKQLAYHIEIARIGAIEALIRGYLGQELEIDSMQKLSLQEKRDVVQRLADEKIHRVMIAWRDEVFSELNSTQRAQAGKLLGKEFYLREDPSGITNKSLTGK